MLQILIKNLYFLNVEFEGYNFLCDDLFVEVNMFVVLIVMRHIGDFVCVGYISWIVC